MAAAKKGSGKSATRKKKKVSKNLLLDAAVVERAERYSRKHGTNLSRLVTDFLARLHVNDESRLVFGPIVTRLRGVAGDGQTDREDYRQHLLDRYGKP